MNEKIKILQTVGSLGIGGNEIFAMNFFRNVDRERFSVDFISYDDERLDFYEEILSNEGKVYICKSKKKNKYLAMIDRAKMVLKILNENDYDIIHCHSCSFLGLFSGVIAGKVNKKVKIISHAHNPGTPSNIFSDKIIRNIFKITLSKTIDLGFTCSSNAGESKYTEKFIKSNNYAIIKNAINTEKFKFNLEDRLEKRNLYGIKDEIVIGTIGRLEKQKNQIYMLKIFKEIIKINEKAKLIIIGEGSLRKELEKYANENNMVNNIIFTGQVSDSNKYYSMMDGFILTSIYEGFPFVMVESQVNGLPGVVSDAVVKEVNILNNIEFISLQENELKWAKTILNNVRKNNIESLSTDEIILDYDLKNQAKVIENYYKQLKGV